MILGRDMEGGWEAALFVYIAWRCYYEKEMTGDVEVSGCW